jgi:hypothetical protein
MPLDKDAAKEVVKEALKEWLDEKYADFGKWTMAGLAATVIAGGTYLFLLSSGWHR